MAEGHKGKQRGLARPFSNYARTSKEAWLDIQAHSSRIQRLCMHTLRTKGQPITRRQLSKYAELELCTVTGCINRLVELGFVIEVGTTKCPLSGRTAKLITLPAELHVPKKSWRPPHERDAHQEELF